MQNSNCRRCLWALPLIAMSSMLAISSAVLAGSTQKNQLKPFVRAASCYHALHTRHQVTDHSQILLRLRELKYAVNQAIKKNTTAANDSPHRQSARGASNQPIGYAFGATNLTAAHGAPPGYLQFLSDKLSQFENQHLAPDLDAYFSIGAIVGAQEIDHELEHQYTISRLDSIWLDQLLKKEFPRVRLETLFQLSVAMYALAPLLSPDVPWWLSVLHLGFWGAQVVDDIQREFQQQPWLDKHSPQALTQIMGFVKALKQESTASLTSGQYPVVSRHLVQILPTPLFKEWLGLADTNDPAEIRALLADMAREDRSAPLDRLIKRLTKSPKGLSPEDEQIAAAARSPEGLFRIVQIDQILSLDEETREPYLLTVISASPKKRGGISRRTEPKAKTATTEVPDELAPVPVRSSAR